MGRVKNGEVIAVLVEILGGVWMKFCRDLFIFDCFDEYLFGRMSFFNQNFTCSLSFSIENREKILNTFGLSFRYFSAFKPRRDLFR
jgi:hypothetical protein